MLRLSTTVLLVALVCVAVPGQAAVINVPGYGNLTIQQGVNAASPGDTVFIGPGVYHEHVLITTNGITLQGFSRDSCIIDATQNGSRLPGIRLTEASGVTIRDLTVQNAALGFASGDVDIEQYGIVTGHSDGNLYENLKLLNNGLYEMFFWDGCDNNTVRNCVMDGKRDATYESLDGIFSSGGSVAEGGHDRINTGNVFTNNVISNVVFGYSLTASNDTQITNSQVHASDSTFWLGQGYYSYGVNIYASSNNTVQSNVIDTSEQGVRFRDPVPPSTYDYAGPSDNNNVLCNMITSTVYGIAIRGCADNVIQGNAISGAGTAGIALMASTSNQTTGTNIAGNDLANDTIGIQTDNGSNSATNNNIHGNTAFGVSNTDAVTTFDAQNNWWGAADGPGPVGPGSGDKVSTMVDYTPFLSDPSAQIAVTLELEGIVTTPVNRTIHFVVGSSDTELPLQYDIALTFTNRTATTTLLVPSGCAEWMCISAKDTQHSVYSTQGLLELGVGQYTASLTGANKLLGGDIDNNDVDDVYDFGVLAVQWKTTGHPYPIPALDADLDDNGKVYKEDFLILYSHYLERGDPPCGLTEGQLPAPVSRITVAQLAPLVGGLTNARKADLNRDGYVDNADVRLFYYSNVLQAR